VSSGTPKKKKKEREREKRNGAQQNIDEPTSLERSERRGMREHTKYSQKIIRLQVYTDIDRTRRPHEVEASHKTLNTDNDAYLPTCSTTKKKLKKIKKYTLALLQPRAGR